MRDARLCLNEQEEPHEKFQSVFAQGREVWCFVETLENQIINRAHKISLRRGNHQEQSLASWLEAAREILSGNSEKLR